MLYGWGMPAVCFYFQVHQPWRIKRYTLFDVDSNQHYFDDKSDTDLNNSRILKKVAKYCYIPTNRILLELLKQNPDFKIAYCLSGTLLDQLEKYLPEVLDSFKALVATGQVEMLNETYYHSLSFIYSQEEFKSQVKLHQVKIKELFGQTPKIFRNTELVYNNQVALVAESLGYKGILAEGVTDVLDWRSPNFIYEPPNTQSIKLLLKNFRLSDDIAFRFSERSWASWPLTADKFAQWINDVNGCGDVVNLFMDYETFGEHQHKDSGIFDFLRALPEAILRHPDNSFVTPTEAIEKFPSRDVVDIKRVTSWADVERDLTAWTGNEMQKTVLAELYALESDILSGDDSDLINDWRRLQTSDHFYYMCTKWFADGDVHAYFNPYDSPYDAYTSYINVLEDLKMRLNKITRNNIQKQKIPIINNKIMNICI